MKRKCYKRSWFVPEDFHQLDYLVFQSTSLKMTYIEIGSDLYIYSLGRNSIFVSDMFRYVEISSLFERLANEKKLL